MGNLGYRPFSFEYSNRFPVEYDEEDNAIGPGSRQLAEAIIKAVREQNIECSDLDQHSYYGWCFATELKGLTFFNVLHPIRSEATLTVSLKWMWIKKLFRMRPQDVFNEYCETISESMASISGISGGKWGNYFF